LKTIFNKPERTGRRSAIKINTIIDIKTDPSK